MIADRHKWALEVLQIRPSDRLLEIGCGTGALAALICGHLTDGRLTAIDRSEKMIRTAAKLNAPFLSEGKARFVRGTVHEADLGEERYHKILAVNVNGFWMEGGSGELSVIKQWLSPGGLSSCSINPLTRESCPLYPSVPATICWTPDSRLRQ